MSDSKPPKVEVISVKPEAFSNASFTKKQWNVLDGLKVNGAGQGYFEYTIPLDSKIDLGPVKEAYFLIEISAKELFVKDLDVKEEKTGDFMLGAKASPSGNPNSYPMTDEKLFPSKVTISVDGKVALSTTLGDDPADHRGILSWHHQLKDKKLREAGSYGYLTKVPVTKAQLKEAAKNGKLVIQIKTAGDGGVAVYGKSFGRYPLDPSLVMKKK
jgi:predicted transcriptional regulator